MIHDIIVPSFCFLPLTFFHLPQRARGKPHQSESGFCLIVSRGRSSQRVKRIKASQANIPQ